MKGLKAIITGAGSGIGRAIALDLAKEGVDIALVGGKREEKLIETKNLLLSEGVRCEYFAGDLRNDKTLEDCYNKAKIFLGGLDILINNAGLTHNSLLENTEMKVFDDMMAVNIRVPYHLTKVALADLKNSKRASIINIASVVAHSGYAWQSAYSASKHALLGFTKALSAEVYKEGIRVHAVSPGGVFTDMVKISRPDLNPDGMIMPEDVSSAVLFLLKNRTNAVIDEILIHRDGKQPFLV